jgi:amino acid adenylation domain-containing protein
MDLDAAETATKRKTLALTAVRHSWRTQNPGGGRCVHESIEEQVARTPERVAVEFEGTRLTYRELNDRANQLARYLASMRVGPGVPVGLCLDRGLEMVVGVLGILKAGAALLPLDPAFPRERLEFMLHDSRAPVVVTRMRFLENWPAGGDQNDEGSSSMFCNSRVVCVDRDGELIRQEDRENPGSSCKPEDLVHVLYTSGSTGKPKGVEILHRAVVNVLASIRQKPGFTQKDVILAIATLSFDISGLELYLPLMTGAKLVMVSRDVASDGRKLARELERSKATVLQATPSTWRMLVEAGWKGDGRLKMLCGGEALPRQLAAALLERGGELWNLYGPTETTIYSTRHRVRLKDERILIGRPIANTDVYILDEHQQAVPVGVPGELYIGGAGLARGYLNRPELTASKFISNPFDPQGKKRLYRTGDIARRASDGSIEYLGRKDQQVKIRGFRIELGEIEAAMGSHPQIRQCVVHVDEREGQKRLVAYIVTSGPVRVKELRRHLARRLPDYMVPALYVPLRSFPLTASGKVDRKTLPKPEEVVTELGEAFAAPADDLELKLVTIWEEVLGRKHIGVRDDFFELGGDSLTAVNLVLQIEKQLGRDLNLPAIVGAPTVEAQARLLRKGALTAQQLNVVALQPLGEKPPLFCLNWTFLYQHLAQRLSPDQPVYGVYSPIENELRAAAEGKPILLTVEELAARYARAIRMVRPSGPYHLAGISFGGVLAFEVAQQLSRAGEAVGVVALMDALLPRSFKPLRLPQMRRIAYHVRQSMKHGARYLGTKLRNRLARESRRLQQCFHKRQAVTGPHPEVTTERLEQLRVWFMDQLAARYQPGVYPGKIVLFRAEEHDLSFRHRVDEANGWGELAAGGLVVENIPGNHNDLPKETSAPVLATRLREHLLKAFEQGQCNEKPRVTPTIAKWISPATCLMPDLLALFVL